MKGNRHLSGEPDFELKKIMLMKKAARWLRKGFYLFVVLTFALPVLNDQLSLDLPPVIAWIMPIACLLLSTMGADVLSKSALRAQKERGLDKTPDELEEERQNDERLKRLVASPASMNRELKRLTKLSRFLSRLFMIGLWFIVADIALAVMSGFGVEFSDGFIIAMAFITMFLLLPVFFVSSIEKKQKELSLQYTPGVLNEVMDRLESYDPHGSVDHGYLWEDFAFGQRDRIGRCGDYVKGVVHGIPFESSEFEIQYEAETTDSDGHRTKEIRTSFSGLMAVCRHGFKLSNVVTMTQFSRYFREIRTESVDFSRAWSIKEGSGYDAFLVLTPQYMEKLMELIREKGRRMGLQFRPDGTLLIVLQGANFFEADGAEKVGELQDKIRNEILELADIMQRVGALTLDELENEEKG